MPILHGGHSGELQASHDALESKETFPQDQIANKADIKQWIQLDAELQLVQIDLSWD